RFRWHHHRSLIRRPLKVISRRDGRDARRLPGRKHPMKRSSVSITGVGLTCSMGHSYKEFSSNLLASASGIDKVAAFDVSDHPSQLAILIGQIPCPPGYDATEFQSRLRIEQCGIWCAETALRDAGLQNHSKNLRIGLVLGLGAEWMQSWEMDYRRGG